MIYKRSFVDDAEKEAIIKEMHDDGKLLTEVQHLIDGNFLLFTDEPPEDLRIDSLEVQNSLSKAQIQAISERRRK